eukprot:CAMPEP_0174291552 /NCGR_PEP_ID=MMETSP0809-20121228/32463_1 /TAXON_ID=73025 ORGANISM="Eutreptiella gymnastica-like, Strain CCMP1594" /NCGR_SAMPLE_ID=MMETSP0809 /ASSEMBLY_ACC=CAM_ASM_000658 /LENGTH=116 /DNA_ID=CAMNT_0015390959 /DNA_START=136 /DNA_END=487 /DNA_ORIENTATION=-
MDRGSPALWSHMRLAAETRDSAMDFSKRFHADSPFVGILWPSSKQKAGCQTEHSTGPAPPASLFQLCVPAPTLHTTQRATGIGLHYRVRIMVRDMGLAVCPMLRLHLCQFKSNINL